LIGAHKAQLLKPNDQCFDRNSPGSFKVGKYRQSHPPTSACPVLEKWFRGGEEGTGETVRLSLDSPGVVRCFRRREVAVERKVPDFVQDREPLAITRYRVFAASRATDPNERRSVDSLGHAQMTPELTGEG